MADTCNWGIIGPGSMAHKFATELQRLPEARIHAVASRSLERARVFAKQYGAGHVYGNQHDIVNCPDLDLVYIATPHALHHAAALRCLEHRIPVLCEKPLAMNARLVQEMVNLARGNKVFLMEALWTRFLPAIDKMLELIDTGQIGDLLSVKADFGFRGDPERKPRLYDRTLGGGALLDIGIYPVFLALLLLGRPTTLHATAQFGASGVDEEIGVLFHYADGRLAHLHSSIRSQTRTEAFIYGTTGTLHIQPPWHGSSSISLLREGRSPEAFRFQYPGEGYAFEAAHVMDRVKHSQRESEKLPLDFSQQLIGLLDEIRQSAGIHYPDLENHG